MPEEINTALNRGLENGYAGNSAIEHVRREDFVLESSTTSDPDGTVYVDQRLAKSNGGGQEIIRTRNGETATRLYAGGLIPPERLTELGITEKDTMDFLKYSIFNSKGQTRLNADYVPKANGDWQYSYEVLQHEPEIDLTIAQEKITYKGRFVFAHGFLKSPVK